MKNDRDMWRGVAMVFAAVMVMSSTVHAAPERKLLILLDASFSMSTPRVNTDGKGAIRWEAAKSLAADRIHDNEIITDLKPLKVAIYTFRGDDAAPILHTDGFVLPQQAKFAVLCLAENPALVTEVDCSTLHDGGAPFELGGASAGNTPLALALCKSADVFTPFAGDGKLLRLISDGEENSSLTSDCAGAAGVEGVYDPVGGTWGPPTSWQARSIEYYRNKTIVAKTDLLETPPLVFPTLTAGGSDPEGRVAPAARLRSLTASATTGLNPLEQFFTSLAQATGGDLTVAHDDEPLPVIGDLNGDRCVDHTDALAVARAFGPIVPPGDGRFDFNGDGVVDFNDYLSQLGRISGTCGSDPYVARPPILCNGSTRVVIDGQSIEDQDITIDARGACQITIKNSLLVSGKNAITIVGTASLTVDHSVIVGQQAVLVQRGAVVLSAANSVFHGKLDTKGAFIYTDRGGNVFE